MAVSMFSRRYYEAIAAVLREAAAYSDTDAYTLDRVRFLFSNAFEADNERFHRDTFKKECER